MPQILIRQAENEQDRSPEPKAQWGKYGPLVLAGAMALALWAFSGGQQAAPPPTTGLVASPAAKPTTSVEVVTTVNEPDPADETLVRPTTEGKGAIGEVELEPVALVPVALYGRAEQLVTDSSDTLWWRADWGLGRYDPTSSETTFYTVGEDLFFGSISAIAPAAPSGVWAGGRDGTLRRFDGERFVEVIETPEPLCQVVQSPTLGVWGVGCGWGEDDSALDQYRRDLREDGGWLYRWNEDSWEPEAEGRPLAGAAELTVDWEGRVWVANREPGKGVNSVGASVFDGESWTTFTVDDGLPSGVIQAIAGAPPGELWVRTFKGPSVYDGNVWRSPSGDAELDRREWRGLESIVEDGDQRVALARFGSTMLIRSANGELTRTPIRGTVRTDLVGASGAVWLASDGELLRIEGAELNPVISTAPRTESLSPPDPESWQITAVSGDEALLLAGGVPWHCTTNGGCETWPAGFSVTDLVIDYEGRAIALSHEDLLLLDDGVWTTLTPITAWEALHDR